LAGVAEVLARAIDRAVEAVERLEKMHPSEWMTAEEAAAYVRRTPEAFHKLVLNEGVPRHRISGQRYLYSRAEIDAWIMGR
jgi:excisionase family DNA binding protein